MVGFIFVLIVLCIVILVKTFFTCGKEEAQAEDIILISFIVIFGIGAIYFKVCM